MINLSRSDWMNIRTNKFGWVKSFATFWKHKLFGISQCFCRALEGEELLWNAELARYSPWATWWICLYDLKHSLEIHTFRSTWSCLIAEVMATRVGFLLTGITCSFTFCTIIFFFLVVSAALWLNSKSYSICYRIWQRRTFICSGFELLTV